MKKVLIGTRGSKLAVVQATTILDALRKRHPSHIFELVEITTQGDRMSATPASEFWGVGVFVKELESALADGSIDMAVHSLKDMPVDITPGMLLAAVPVREDVREALVSSGGGIKELMPGARVGTGSPRRQAQLLHHRPDLKVDPIRGNVDTRLRKVASGEFDAIVLAAAALHRLGWEDRVTEYLPPDFFLPAPGQGALAVETREGDEEMSLLAAAVNDEATFHCVAAERSFLRALGGGCRAPVAALGRADGDRLTLTGMIVGAGGQPVFCEAVEGPVREAESLGVELAEGMLSAGGGASEIIREARSF